VSGGRRPAFTSVRFWTRPFTSEHSPPIPSTYSAFAVHGCSSVRMVGKLQPYVKRFRVLLLAGEVVYEWPSSRSPLLRCGSAQVSTLHDQRRSDAGDGSCAQRIGFQLCGTSAAARSNPFITLNTTACADGHRQRQNGAIVKGGTCANCRRP